VTLSADNPISLLTFSRKAGKTLKLSAQKTSGDSAFLEYFAPTHTTRAELNGMQSLTMTGPGGYLLRDEGVFTAQLPATEDSNGFVILTYSQDSKKPTTVELSIKAQ
jgi:hypothetical protein